MVQLALDEALRRLGANDTGLTTLALYHNQIGAEGAEALANALKRNTSLTTLYLSDNQIGAEGGKAFANALTDRRTSAFLHLRNNFGNWSATVLADALGKYNSTLEGLCTDGIGKELNKQIQDLLSRNKKRYS